MGGRGASSGSNGGGGGLPALTGSPKQIDWATKVRDENLSSTIKMVNSSSGKADSKKAYKDWITSKTSSAWWIDRSKYTKMSFINEFAKDYLKSKK